MTIAVDYPLWRIVRYRYAHQKDFAAAIGYGPEYVARVKVGTYPMTANFRAKCAEVLGMSEEDLFGASNAVEELAGG